MIEILGWATSRNIARQFLETTEIATWDNETQAMVPHKDIQLHPFRPTESIDVVKTPAVMNGDVVVTPAVIAPGYHFNIRIYGNLEHTLRKDAANAPDDKTVWNELKLKDYIDNKLGSAATLRNKEVSGAKLPGGYEWSIGANKVRLYEATLVNQRANVWA